MASEYTSPESGAVNFSEESSYPPPANDAVNFSEKEGSTPNNLSSISVDTGLISSETERLRTTVTTTEEADSISSSPDRNVEVVGQSKDVSTVDAIIALTPIRRNSGTGSFGIENSREVVFLNVNTGETVFGIENEGET